MKTGVVTIRPGLSVPAGSAAHELAWTQALREADVLRQPVKELEDGGNVPLGTMLQVDLAYERQRILEVL